jgi:hypothetical protein
LPLVVAIEVAAVRWLITNRCAAAGILTLTSLSTRATAETDKALRWVRWFSDHVSRSNTVRTLLVAAIWCLSMPSIGGFWSYAYSDDDRDEGRIGDLSRHLRNEYGLLTGEELEIFIDREDLAWGDDWREKITEALERVTFFIPILTPTYFLRSECRRELMQFAEQAKKQGAEKLILPIYYIEVPELEREGTPTDSAMALAKDLHRWDLRGLRLEDQDRASYRRQVNDLALEIMRISRGAEQSGGEGGSAGARRSPEPPPSPDPSSAVLEGSSARETGEVDGDGLIDRMARGEGAIDKLVEPLKAIGVDIEKVGNLATEATAEMEAGDAAGKPAFATRLAISRKMAQRLEEPAAEMEVHTQEYVALLWDVDPFIGGLLDILHSDPEEWESADTRELVETMEGMVAAGQSTTKTISELESVIGKNTDFSRELRAPLRQIQTSLRNLIDAQAVLDQWEKKLRELAERPPGGKEN